MTEQRSGYLPNNNVIPLTKSGLPYSSNNRVASSDLVYDTNVKEGDMSLTRDEMNARISQSQAELRADIAEFKTEIKTGFANTQAEIHKAIIDLIKWIVGVGIALATIFFTALNYFNNSHTQKGLTQQPIVITTPLNQIDSKNKK